MVNSAFAGDLSNFGMQNVVDCVVKRGAFAVKAWLKTPANSARLKQAKSFVPFSLFVTVRHGDAVEEIGSSSNGDDAEPAVHETIGMPRPTRRGGTLLVIGLTRRWQQIAVRNPQRCVISCRFPAQCWIFVVIVDDRHLSYGYW